MVEPTSTTNESISNTTQTNQSINITTKQSTEPINLNNNACDPSKINKGEQLIIATHNSITFLKATNENGKIVPGDYLTASSKAGYAMKADENSVVLMLASRSPSRLLFKDSVTQ